MIHYDLRCSQDHAFDGWFKDSAAFERLAEAWLVECPHCGDGKIERALMRPAVAKRENAAGADAGGKAARAAGCCGGGHAVPAQMRAMLQRMRAEVEKNCDYVGPKFAEEARKIHRGESEKRGIYGETSPEQAESLADEGIEFSQHSLGAASGRVARDGTRHAWQCRVSRLTVRLERSEGLGIAAAGAKAGRWPSLRRLLAGEEEGPALRR